MTRTSFTDGSGRWFNKNAATSYEEHTWFNGNNRISTNTGSQWDHEELFLTKSNKWVMHSWSQWQGSGYSYEEISESEAHKWLLKNEHFTAVPDDTVAEMEV